MNEIKLKYTLNKRYSEKNSWLRWDLKNGRKIVASVVKTPNYIRAEAFCFRKQAKDGQSLENFKEEIKEEIRSYLESCLNG